MRRNVNDCWRDTLKKQKKNEKRKNARGQRAGDNTCKQNVRLVRNCRGISVRNGTV